MQHSKARIYTVHEKWREDNADETMLLVREGFNLWAFFFHVLWLLYKQQWVAFMLFTPLFVGVVTLGDWFGLDEITVGILQVGLQVWLGFNAADIQRFTLQLRGYRLMDIVVAPSDLMAEQRYLDRKHAATPTTSFQLQLA